MKGNFIMTSKQIIKKTAEATGIPQKKIKEIVDALEVAVKTTVSDGESFKALDISYSLVDVEAAEKRNPKTGEKVMSPAHKKVKAKLSADFKRIAR